MHAVTINKALSSVSRLHGYYIGDYVMAVELLLHQLGGKKDANYRGQTNDTTATSGGDEMTLFL
jgi:hypothetical protein